jgi:hypothetical protein
VIDTYSKAAFVKLYDRKNAFVDSAEVFNDKVVPWFKEQDVRILRTLSDREAEYCGKR